MHVVLSLITLEITIMMLMLSAKFQMGHIGEQSLLTLRKLLMMPLQSAKISEYHLYFL